MGIYLVISVAVFVLSVFGMIYWSKRTSKWDTTNYSGNDEYFYCMAIGWISMMCMFISIIGFIGSIICLVGGGLSQI